MKPTQTKKVRREKKYQLVHTCKPDENGVAICGCCLYKEVKPTQQTTNKLIEKTITAKETTDNLDIAMGYKKPTQTIEEKTLSEFDKKFTMRKDSCFGLHPLISKRIKSFILSALSQMREATIDECLGEIEKGLFKYVKYHNRKYVPSTKSKFSITMDTEDWNKLKLSVKRLNKLKKL